MQVWIVTFLDDDGNPVPSVFANESLMQQYVMDVADAGTFDEAVEMLSRADGVWIDLQEVIGA